MTHIIYDNGISREMTTAEIAEYEQTAQQSLQAWAAIQRDIEAQQAAAASARAKLAALGLTEAEVAAILGA